MKYILLLVMYSSFLACKSNSTEPEKEWNSEMSSEMNKHISFDEDIKIQAYLDPKKNWKIEQSGSGLRYAYLKNVEGENAKSGDVAIVEYEVALLDGTICYKTENDETRRFKIDHSDIETGVQEGIKKMSIGDEMVLIIPSHIAHGLMGDLDKIPPLQPLVVTLTLIDLN